MDNRYGQQYVFPGWGPSTPPIHMRPPETLHTNLKRIGFPERPL